MKKKKIEKNHNILSNRQDNRFILSRETRKFESIMYGNDSADLSTTPMLTSTRNN